MERWKDIKDFIGYQISDRGRVRSFHKFKAGQQQSPDILTDKPHIMDTEKSDDGNGYRKVMLRKNGKSYCRKIHRLVAEAFVPNPENYDTVDHISNDKRDNNYKNLQWISRRDNIQKAYRDGLCDERIKKSRINVLLINETTNEIKRFDSVGKAADFLGVHYTSVSHAAKECYPIRGYWIEYSNGGLSRMQEVINKFPGYRYVSKIESEDGKAHNMFRGVDLGFGGYSYAEPGIYTNVALIDVQSMHPHSIVALNYFGEYTPRFKEILDARIAIKNGDFEKARTMFDGKLAKYLDDESKADVLAQALKIAINSCYGLTSAKFDNPMRDPRNVNNIVALRGALFMKTLLDDLQSQGITVCHLKVDSMKIPEATPDIIEYCQEFANRYGYNFAHEATYERICLVNKSEYVAAYMREEECLSRYGYIPSDNKKHFKKHNHPWTTTGDAFQHPYIFKTLFSGENIEFKDRCEIRSVNNKSHIYLDNNEGLKDVSKYELELEKRNHNKEETDASNHKKLNPELKNFTDDDLKNLISEGHDYFFIGQIGNFFPVRDGCGGGLLVVKRDDKFESVTGSKGFRWFEAERAKIAHMENDYSHEYFDTLIDEAVKKANSFGSFERFIDLTRPYEYTPEDISPAADDDPPWSVVPCGDGKYNTCMDCPNYKNDICKRGYSLDSYIEDGRG